MKGMTCHKLTGPGVTTTHQLPVGRGRVLAACQVPKPKHQWSFLTPAGLHLIPSPVCSTILCSIGATRPIPVLTSGPLALVHSLAYFPPSNHSQLVIHKMHGDRSSLGVSWQNLSTGPESKPLWDLLQLLLRIHETALCCPPGCRHTEGGVHLRDPLAHRWSQGFHMLALALGAILP